MIAIITLALLKHFGGCLLRLKQKVSYEALTMSSTRTPNSPLRYEFVACYGWR